jgi:hypothetical protein
MEENGNIDSILIESMRQDSQDNNGVSALYQFMFRLTMSQTLERALLKRVKRKDMVKIWSLGVEPTADDFHLSSSEESQEDLVDRVR